MSSKAFTAKTFTFLHQINHNPRLQKIDAAVALELTVYFNEGDHDGRAWPGCKTVADAIGVSETTVIRSVHRLATEGHLRVIWGSQGRGHPHQYWMVVKPAPVKVSKAGNPASVTRLKPASVKIKPAFVQENLLKNHPLGFLTEPPRVEERENALTRVDSDLGGRGRLEGAAPQEDLAKEESGLPTKEETYAKLRAGWVRPYPDDEDEDRKAFDEACREVAPEIVLATGLAYARCFTPDMLCALAKWLKGRGYLKPPPARRRRAATSPRSNGGKVDLAKLMMRHGGRREDESGVLVPGGRR